MIGGYIAKPPAQPGALTYGLSPASRAKIRRMQSRKAVLLFCTVATVGLIVLYFVMHSLGKKKGADIFALPIFAAVFMYFFYSTSDYTYVDSFAFLTEELTIGITVGVLLSVVFFWKGKSIATRILIMILSCLVCVVFSWAMITNLNYLLDFSEPKYYSAVIEDKDFDHHRKSPDSYEFKLTADGKSFYLEVPRSTYKAYDVGDTYSFKKYNGAFGKPFFLPAGFKD